MCGRPDVVCDRPHAFAWLHIRCDGLASCPFTCLFHQVMDQATVSPTVFRQYRQCMPLPWFDCLDLPSVTGVHLGQFSWSTNPLNARSLAVQPWPRYWNQRRPLAPEPLNMDLLGPSLSVSGIRGWQTCQNLHLHWQLMERCPQMMPSKHFLMTILMMWQLARWVASDASCLMLRRCVHLESKQRCVAQMLERQQNWCLQREKTPFARGRAHRTLRVLPCFVWLCCSHVGKWHTNVSRIP